MKQKTKVYILGAGCSARYDYPLAKDFVPQLESFGKTLGDDAVRLRDFVDETVASMRRENVQTIDDLAARLHDDSFEAASGSPIHDEQRREQRIRNAKLAAAAMLLSKENAANRAGLRNYHDLLREICPGRGDWQHRLRSSHCRVLTFNYDRLFEIAALNLIGPDLARKGLYGECLLNSGFYPFGDRISFADEGFCFLKLHGSVGACVNFQFSETHYHPSTDNRLPGSEIKITDELFLRRSDDKNPLRSEPLIVFPHEKHHVQSGGRHTVYEKYLTTIWSKAREIVAAADEIWVIGYSFAALDRLSVINLLSGATNSQRVVIQNIGGEAKRLHDLLSLKHPEVKLNWTPFECEF